MKGGRSAAERMLSLARSSCAAERLPEAMRHIMTGHARAKIVVRISRPPPAPS
jgi:hypothetical protein